MSSLVSLLSAPRHTQQQHAASQQAGKASPATAVVAHGAKAPPYGHRRGWIPRTLADFGDGGAFPEIHVAQFPLDMGRKTSKKTLPVTLDESGEIKYDAVLRGGGGSSKKTVYSKAKDLVPVAPSALSADDLALPSEKEVKSTTDKTREALESIVGRVTAKTRAAHVENTGSQPEPTFIRYTPSRGIGSEHNSGARTRVIRMVEKQLDPMEPPKFQHKRAPRGPPSPPAPVMHSPPRKVSAETQKEWDIPPCISSWKNAKGYTVPLDKRLAADGRGLQDTQVSDRFAKFAEALYIAESNAREEVRRRAEVRKQILMREKATKEETLRQLAAETRSQKAELANPADETPDEREARLERDRIRDDRGRDRERARRMAAAGKKSKVMRDGDRDVSERIALGERVPNSGATQFDQRLFNQTQGMDSGFGAEDSYNVYDKPLMTTTSHSMLHRPKASTDDAAFAEQDMKSIMSTDRFKPDKEFSGASEAAEGGRRDGPVQFEREEDDDDDFGLETFHSKAKRGGDGDRDGRRERHERGHRRDERIRRSPDRQSRRSKRSPSPRRRRERHSSSRSPKRRR